MGFIAQEQELGRELPRVIGNVDYAEYRAQLESIDGLLVKSGIERRFVEAQLDAWLLPDEQRDQNDDGNGHAEQQKQD